MSGRSAGREVGGSGRAGTRPMAWLGVCLVLYCVATIAQDVAAERAGAMLVGPLYGGLQSMVPLVVLFLVGTRGAAAGSRWRVPALGAALLAGLIYLYGIGVYWSATPRGVTFHRGFLAATRSLDWSDVSGRELSCSSGRHSTSASFSVRFRDGTTIAISSSDDAAGQAQFELLGGWSDGHPVTSSGSRCPDFVAGFLEGLKR